MIEVQGPRHSSIAIMAGENKGPILLAVTILCYCLAFVGTAARIYVRNCLVNLMGWDDYLIIAALVSVPNSHSGLVD